MKDVYQRILKLETTPEALEATVCYLAERMKPFLSVLEPVLLTGALLICTAYLVDGSFNPFLYFRF